MSFDPTEVYTQEDGLTVYTYYLECLAHGSYIVAHEGNAFIVDPRRDIGIYVDAIHKHKLNLKGVLESHAHADFVSGHMELNKRYGTTIFIGENAGARFPHYPVGEGDLLKLSSKYNLRSLPTPGHTFGCVTWLVEERDTGKEVLAFTGDTLFVGGIGRPDLVGALIKDATPEKLSKAMYSSLQKLATLPASCKVLPAHGPGSPCGKGISAELSSTIGKELETNPAFGYKNESDFIAWNTSGLDTAPQYFPNAVLTNIAGAENTATEVNKIPILNIDQFKAKMAEPDVYVLDTRDADKFAKEHIKGSLNIPIGHGGGVHLEYEDGNFAIWVGTLIPPKKDILLVSDPKQEQETIERLARIGYAAQISGMLKFEIPAWKEAGEPLEHFDKVTIRDAQHVEELKKDHIFIDLRTPGEHTCVVRGHIKGSINMPLNHLDEYLSGLDKDNKYIAYCLGGFRSAIGTSILRKNGFNAVDIVEGYDHGVLPKAKAATTAHTDAAVAK